MDCKHARLACPSPTPKLAQLMSIESVMPSNHFTLYYPLFLLPSMFPSIRIFSNESVLCIRCSEFCIFSISLSNEHSGLISFGMDCLDLLAIQDSQESYPTPQFKSISSSVLSLLYSPTLNPYMTTRKTIALARWTFVSKVMSLLFLICHLSWSWLFFQGRSVF